MDEEAKEKTNRSSSCVHGRSEHTDARGRAVTRCSRVSTTHTIGEKFLLNSAKRAQRNSLPQPPMLPLAVSVMVFARRNSISFSSRSPLVRSIVFFFFCDRNAALLSPRQRRKCRDYQNYSTEALFARFKFASHKRKNRFNFSIEAISSALACFFRCVSSKNLATSFPLNRSRALSIRSILPPHDFSASFPPFLPLLPVHRESRHSHSIQVEK